MFGGRVSPLNTSPIEMGLSLHFTDSKVNALGISNQGMGEGWVK